MRIRLNTERASNTGLWRAGDEIDLPADEAVRLIRSGQAETPFLRHGDRVRIEMRDAAGHSIFGAIEGDVSTN